MADENLYKPGELAPKSGQYELTGSRGGSKGVEITSTKGNPLPPTTETGLRYRLVDPTKHKGDK